MEENIIETTELEKTFRGFQNVPKGDTTTAYVFFQSKDNSKYAISTEKRKVMSAQIRTGKYDRIMTIHRGRFKKMLSKQIACEEMGHNFLIDITVDYFISDPEAVYLQNNYHIGEQIEKSLSDVEFQMGQKYGFRDQAAFKKELYELIMEKIRQLSFLDCSVQLDLDVDADAKTIIEREHSHEYKNIDADLGAVEKQNQLMNDSELEQMRLEEEKKKVQLEQEIQTMQMDHLGDLIKKYGINAGNMIDHVDGKMSGSQLSNVIAATLKGNKDDEYNRILEFYREGMITSDVVEKLLISKIRTDEGNNITGFLNEKSEDKETDPEEIKESFQWNNTDGEDEEIK